MTRSNSSINFYAESYDESVPDWPGELDFYLDLVLKAKRRKESLLELACGTGRVTIRLGQKGIDTVGLDLSARMLAEARQKGKGIPNLRWVRANMCRFDLKRTFGLIIIPGHAFQNLNTPREQADCLAYIHRHLSPSGRVVIHLDHPEMDWLGDLTRDKGGVFEPGEEFTHQLTGQRVQAFHAWTYEPSTQTAVSLTEWRVLGPNGEVLDKWKNHPARLHVVFRFEMEHLLARTGFEIVNLYGDFYKSPFEDTSHNMIWVAKKKH